MSISGRLHAFQQMFWRCLWKDMNISQWKKPDSGDRSFFPSRGRHQLCLVCNPWHISGEGHNWQIEWLPHFISLFCQQSGECPGCRDTSTCISVSLLYITFIFLQYISETVEEETLQGVQINCQKLKSLLRGKYQFNIVYFGNFVLHMSSHLSTTCKSHLQ